MGELPNEAEKLLAVNPTDFVAERNRLARELREAGRSEEAAAVSALKKPSVVIFAVNRAARDRPQAARAAAEAAERVETAQSGGKPEAFRAAAKDLDASLDLLGEVAVAHVSQPGKAPTDAMRRRVHDLLRRAVASEETRTALSRGALVEEQEAAGFAPFAGMEVKAPGRMRSTAAADRRVKRQEDERRKRAKALREELAEAEKLLKAAERAVNESERERAKAERAVQAIQAKLDRLT